MNHIVVKALFSAIGNLLSTKQIAGVIDTLMAHGQSSPLPGREKLLKREDLARYVSELDMRNIDADYVFELRACIGAALRYLRQQADAQALDERTKEYAALALANSMCCAPQGIRLLSDFKHPGIPPEWMPDSMEAFTGKGSCYSTAFNLVWRSLRENPIPDAFASMRRLEQYCSLRQPELVCAD